MLNFLLYISAGGYLCYFKSANPSTQTIYLLLYRCLFGGFYFGAIMGNMRIAKKLNACKKYQLYSILCDFLPFRFLQRSMCLCVLGPWYRMDTVFATTPMTPGYCSEYQRLIQAQRRTRADSGTRWRGV